MGIRRSIVVASLALVAAFPAAAQTERARPVALGGETIAANNPAELTVVMMNAGYEVELTTDGVGDPMIASLLARAEDNARDREWRQDVFTDHRRRPELATGQFAPRTVAPGIGGFGYRVGAGRMTEPSLRGVT